jgi:AcrR family transcriptional regulator
MSGADVPVRHRKSAADRKAEIVEVAIALAAEVGPDRVTAEMLAAKIGISQPAIFRHFPNKGAIWLAVAAQIAGFMGQGSDARDDQGDPVDALVALVEAHLSGVARNPAIPAILFSRELHARNDELRAHFAAIMVNRQAVFAALIGRAVEGGAFRQDLAADDAAYLVLALIQGLAMRWSLSGRGFDLVAEGGRLMRLQIAGFAA